MYKGKVIKKKSMFARIDFGYSCVVVWGIINLFQNSENRKMMISLSIHKTF